MPAVVVLGVLEVGRPGFPDSGGAGLLYVETNWFFFFYISDFKGFMLIFKGKF